MATAAIRFENIVETPIQMDRETLIEEHFGLVKFLAGRVGSKLPPSIDADDLVGAGVLGLIDAADRFDPSRGIRFRTYAERRVRGAILDHLRSLDWAPRSLRRRAREIDAAYGSLERDLGRSVSDAEVASFLQIGLDELHGVAFEINSVQMTSLSAGFEADDDANARDIIERLADSTELGPFATCAREEMRERLAQAIDRLPEKERHVISFYYIEELTMKEIGSILGVNESRVSQLHTKAVKRLRLALAPLAS